MFHDCPRARCPACRTRVRAILDYSLNSHSLFPMDWELIGCDFVSVFYNCKRKFYPDGSVRQIASDYALFRVNLSDDDREKRDQPLDDGHLRGAYAMQSVRDDNLKRVKERIFDICALNPFTHFVTWTLDASKIDRYDVNVIRPKILKTLNNLHERQGMEYIVVPERHRDGAVHFHGLVYGDGLRYVDSGHVDAGGHTIYNMPQWRFGYSTAIRLYGDSMRVASYMTKYVTKDLSKIFGKFYFASRSIGRSVPVEYSIIDYDAINVREYRNVYGYKYLVYNFDDQKVMDDG